MASKKRGRRPMKKRWKELEQQAAKVKGSPAEYLMQSGIDYKGQAQMCHVMNGGGISANVSIDPGKVLGLSAEVGVSAGLKRAKENLLLVQRGPDKIEWAASAESIGKKQSNKTPISLNCLQGVQWEGHLGVGFSFGVGAKVGVGGDAGNDKFGKTTSSTNGYNDPETNDPPETSCEIFSFNAGVEAAFKTEAKGSFEHLYAEDKLPLYFKDDKSGGKHSAKEFLRVIVDRGDQKALIKNAVCDFINKNPTHFGAASYNNKSIFGGHISSKALHTQLVNGIEEARRTYATTPSESLELIINKANGWRRLISVFAGETLPIGMCFLYVRTGKFEVSAGVSASASAKAGALGIHSAEAKVEIEGPGAAYQGKRSTIRYQNHTMGEPRLAWTQDTTITYNQFNVTLLKAKAQITDKILGEGIDSADFGTYGKKAAEGVGKEWEVLNSMNYTSTIGYWQRPKNLSRPMTKTTNVKALPGSGIVKGKSCLIKNIYENSNSTALAPTKWVIALAKSLHVTPDVLQTFLRSADVKGVLKDLSEQEAAVKQVRSRAWEHSKNNPTSRYFGSSNKKKFTKEFNQNFMVDGIGDEALLIEAAFKAPSAMTFEVEQRYQATKVGGFMNGHYEEDHQAKLGKANHEWKLDSAHLQSLRLRRRSQDITNKDKTRFSLGFKVLGTGFGIKLESVERAGREAIIDYATAWFDNGVMSASSREKYESGVPAPVLFCQ
jgi:hypothetical protein